MNQQFYTRQDLFFMQIWVGLGYRWVFVLRFTTQWVGLGWRFTTHNPHGLGLGSRLSTHRWVLARTSYEPMSMTLRLSHVIMHEV
jgi:hypothetical protein